MAICNILELCHWQVPVKSSFGYTVLVLLGLFLLSEHKFYCVKNQIHFCCVKYNSDTQKYSVLMFFICY